MDRAYLKSIIVLNNDTQDRLADAIGISTPQLNKKINHSDKYYFTWREMEAIRVRYSMSNNDFMRCFFPNNLA